MSEHIAWARYVHRHEQPTRIELCDSDAEGAFQVYAKPTSDALQTRVAMPEEWRAQAETLIAAFARAVEACYGNSTKDTRLAYIDAQKALIAHISTPPAPKLDISEEEMRREFERIHSAALLRRSTLDDQLYIDACTMAAWIGFQSAIKMMQERCK